jgi:hypothetical protein
MEAKIQTFNDGKWETRYTISTDPVTVTDSTGTPLTAQELELWLDSQPGIPHEGKHLTAKDNLELWLQKIAKARPYTRMRFVVE